MINETGTFYLEGEYQQGDTILSAGDWQLRADGSKNVFAYTPDTFVRRNLLTWSEDFGNTDWFKNGSTIKTNQAIAPDGTLTADKLVMNVGADPNTTNNIGIQNFNRTNISASTHTLSFFAKAAEVSSVRIRENISTGAFLTVDLITGAITNDNSTQYINPSAIHVGNGWWRISFGTATGSTSTSKYGLRVNAVGDGTSGIYIWGAQLELGSTPTPYQRTTTVVPRPYAIKDELVTNGTFDTDTDWIYDGSYSGISGGQLTIGGATTNAIAYQSALVVGRKYKVTVDLDSVGGAAANNAFVVLRQVIDRNSTLNIIGILYSAGVDTNQREFTFTAVNPFIACTVTGGDNFVVLNSISVKEVQQPITLGNASHKDFRYYPKALPENEQEALKA